MSGTGHVIYLYDGTLEGMLCCVWTAFSARENPIDIICFDEEQPTLYEQRVIVTETALADRVQNGIRQKLGPQAEQWVTDAYYSALPRRELAALEFLKLGFTRGAAALANLGHPQVAPLFTASRALHSEVHLLSGFLRFSDHGGALVAVIRPKNFVLPFLEPHFSARFPREHYMIYDETHHYALIAGSGQSRLLETEAVQLPEPDRTELQYRAMWKQFYDTIEIAARHNPKCRMTHVPKRYWDCMDELRHERTPLPLSVRQAIAAGELTLPEVAAPTPAITTPTQASLAAAHRDRRAEKAFLTESAVSESSERSVP